jgi:hypothetical protein
LQVTVTTAPLGGGSPVDGATVTFTAPSSGASGTFANGTITDTETTNALGIANATLFKANSIAGNYTVIAATPGASSSGFGLTNTAAVSLAPGNYVFSLSGSTAYDDTGYPYSLAGAFTVANGLITGGELDFVNPFFTDSDQINGDASTIVTTTDGNMQFTLATCDGLDCTNTDLNIGLDGVVTLDATFLPQNAAKAFVIEFDHSSTSSGTLDLQNATNAKATPSGGYAFGVSGLDAFGAPLTIGGVINVDNNPTTGIISGAGSIFDVNDDDSGSTYAQQTLCSAAEINLMECSSVSFVSSPDPFGRIEFTLTPTTFNPDNSSPAPQIILAGYIVDADHIRLVETVDSFLGTLGGTALTQTGTGTFSSGSVSGKSYVVALNGSDTVGTLQAAGLLTLNPGGTVSGFINYNDLTGLEPQTPSPVTGGTYSVAATGDVTLTGVTDGKTTFNLQLYLDGNGDVMAASVDNTDVLGGVGYQQAAGPFTASSFNGAYALNVTGWDLNRYGELDAISSVTAAGSAGTFSGKFDLNWLFLMPTPAETSNRDISGTFTSNADGIFPGTITGIDVTNCALFTGPPDCAADVFNYYLIDATGDSIVIQTDTNQLTLGYFSQK